MKELFVFYNVENLFLPDPKPVHKSDPTLSGLRNWDNRKYGYKLSKLAHVFQLMKEEQGALPFMIGLCEISGLQVLEDLVSMPPFDGQYGIVHYNSRDERKVDVALLYHRDKVQIHHSEPITFLFETDDGNPGNNKTTRDVLYTKIRYREESMHVFVVHLPSKRENDINLPKRKLILNTIRNRISGLLNENEQHFILCGDFNENPDSILVKEVLENENGDRIMTNPFEALFQEKNYSTYHFKTGLLFDQIILSESFFKKDQIISYHSAHIFKNGKMSARTGTLAGRPYRTYAGTRYLGGYSDHFPVAVALHVNLEQKAADVIQPADKN